MPEVAIAPGCVVMRSLEASPVATKTAGSPLNPVTVARVGKVPGSAPRIRVVPARPSPSVVEVAGSDRPTIIGAPGYLGPGNWIVEAVGYADDERIRQRLTHRAVLPIATNDGELSRLPLVRQGEVASAARYDRENRKQEGPAHAALDHLTACSRRTSCS